MNPNFWRAVIVTQAAIVFVLTLITVVKYAMRFHKAKDWKERTLPAHITFIGISYLILTLGGVMAMLERWGGPPSYRLYLYGSAFVIGNIGLVFMVVNIAFRKKFVTDTDYRTNSFELREKVAIAAELKKQTTSLEAAIRGLHEENVATSVSNAAAQELSATKLEEQREKIDSIQETSADTNERVRTIVPEKKSTSKLEAIVANFPNINAKPDQGDRTLQS